MWMWILISLAVVAVLAVGAAIVFINAMGSAYSIFSASGTRPSLFRWPENLWPRKKEFRFPLPYACMEAPNKSRPPPDVSLAEIAKAADAFSARAEALYAAHKGPKPENAEEFLAAARALRVKAAEQRKLGEEGKAGEQSSAWVSYSESCQFYEMLLSDLIPPAQK